MKKQFLIKIRNQPDKILAANRLSDVKRYCKDNLAGHIDIYELKVEGMFVEP